MRWSVVDGLRTIASLGMQLFFEQVYTIDEWCAGPRAGVANFAGVPHFYRFVGPESDAWAPDEDRFELIPLTPDLLEMLLEADALFRRWHPGPRTPGGSPLDGRGPIEEWARYAELERQIADALAKRHPIAIMRGHFDFDPDRVRWTPIDRVHADRDVSQN
ncbi:MAG TPA: hypothetical protein VJ650_06040 [Gemmatimonadaceae bacterium]|nr:hypothetical protein [Gemmatimonadaceae bacterium]